MFLAIKRSKIQPLPTAAVAHLVQAFNVYGFPRSIVMDLDKWPLNTPGIGAALEVIDTFGISEQNTGRYGNEQEDGMHVFSQL